MRRLRPHHGLIVLFDSHVLSNKKPARTYNVAVLGDHGVGKTSWIERSDSGKFNKKYVSKKAQDTKLSFPVGKSAIKFNCFDAPDLDKENSYDCVALMFDLESRTTYKNAQKMPEEIVSSGGKMPLFVLVGNKSDTPERNVKSITYHQKHSLPYFEISDKDNYKTNAPLMWFAKELLGINEWTVVEEAEIGINEWTVIDNV